MTPDDKRIIKRELLTLAAMRDGINPTLRDLALAIGCSPSTVYMALIGLQRAGLVVKDGRGRAALA